jgi:uncharacterized protein (DUF2235 family)
MPKNIVLCCDGTANEFTQNNTNVVKLYSTLEHDTATQVTFYHPGLGTMEPQGTLTNFSRKVTKLLGMALGYGLSSDVRDAYIFLMQNFEKRDSVFLFGFSRGAYTVRAVASLLHMYGLIDRGNETLVPYAIRMMTGISRVRDNIPKDQRAKSLYFELAREFKSTMSSSDCLPLFVGVWDTVSSVGWIENPLKLPYVTNNPDIQIGRHAVAIDERRAFFRNHLWIRPTDPDAPHGPKDLKQVWFPGVHCDVGGGYPELESGLSKISLEWMLQESSLAGLKVNPHKKATILGKIGNSNFAPPDPNAVLHESLTGAWNMAEFVWKKRYDWKTAKNVRRMNLYQRRTIPPKSLVHESAFLRRGGYKNRLPPDAVPYTNRPEP